MCFSSEYLLNVWLVWEATLQLNNSGIKWFSPHQDMKTMVERYKCYPFSVIAIFIAIISCKPIEANGKPFDFDLDLKSFFIMLCTLMSTLSLNLWFDFPVFLSNRSVMTRGSNYLQWLPSVLFYTFFTLLGLIVRNFTFIAILTTESILI